MARHETAFNTDDPVLITVGEKYREFVIDSHDEAWLLCELAKVIPIPGNSQVIATSPTVDGAFDFDMYAPRDVAGYIAEVDTALVKKVTERGMARTIRDTDYSDYPDDPRYAE